MELGIPYGRQEVVDGGLVTVCPQCGERISELTITEDRYGAHYVKQHATSHGPAANNYQGEEFCCPQSNPCSVHQDPPPNPAWWEAAIAGRCSHGGHGPDETCSDGPDEGEEPATGAASVPVPPKPDWAARADAQWRAAMGKTYRGSSRR